MKKFKNTGNKKETGNEPEPAWKARNNEEVSSKDSEERIDADQSKKQRTVKVRMFTDYRDIAKKGEIVEFDEEKAAELVVKRRGEYVK